MLPYSKKHRQSLLMSMKNVMQMSIRNSTHVFVYAYQRVLMFFQIALPFFLAKPLLAGPLALLEVDET